MSPEDYFYKYQHIAKETVYKIFNNPKGICDQHRIEMADLFQYAATGLWKACITYDETKGTKFLTHAINHVKWHVNERLKRETSIIRYAINRDYEPNEIYGIMSIDAEHSDDSEGKNTYHDIIPSDYDLLENVIGGIEGEQLFSQLTEKQKKIVRLLEKGLSSGEIGKMWGTTPQNVRAYIYNARKRLSEVV
jgi:RNA polymerase sigma factor (sigma-70 family)